MVVSCSAYGCKERFRKGSPYTFHSFPKDEDLRKLWEKALRRKDFVSTKASRICSKHFEPHCFDTEKLGGTWLKQNAVPTVFDFSINLIMKKVVNRKKMPEKHSSDKTRAKIYCDFGDFTEEDKKILKEKEKVLEDFYEDRPKAKRYNYLGDFKEEDMDSPEKSRRVLHLAKTLELENRKIKRKNKFLEKKAASLQAAIKKIKQNCFSSGIIIEKDLTPRMWKNLNKDIVTDVVTD